MFAVVDPSPNRRDGEGETKKVKREDEGRNIHRNSPVINIELNIISPK